MAILTKYISKFRLQENETLLLNALSGAVDIVDDKTIDDIFKIKETKSVTHIEDKALVNNLKLRGYILQSEEEELNLLNEQLKAHNKLMDKNGIVCFIICPTMACNLRCTYCFESEESRSTSVVMSEKQIENIFKHVDTIIEKESVKKSMIQLFGGEPLLPSTLEINSKIFKFAKEKGMIVSIISNGTHIEAYKKLLTEYREIIQSIQITMDGIKEIHDKRRVRVDKTGSFDSICNGIDTLLDIGINVNLRVNVDNGNIDTLKEFVEFIEVKGWKNKQHFNCDIAPVTDHHASNNIEELMSENEIVKKVSGIFPNHDPQNSVFRLTMFRVLNHLNKVLGLTAGSIDSYSLLSYCEANRNQFYVFTPDGYIYACPELSGTKQHHIGTFDEELHLIPKNENLWSDRNVVRMEKCRECNIAPFCGGGCAYAAIKINGNIDDAVCDNAHNVLEEYIESIKEYIIEKYSN